MYKYSNNLLPPEIIDLYVLIMMFINIMQDKSIYFILRRVTLIFMQKSFGNVCVRVWNGLQSKIDVNVPISTFTKSSNYRFFVDLW